MAEFAAAELGVLTGRGPVAAATFIADAVDVRHRLPQHAAGLTTGRVRVWQARHVATRTRTVGLDAEQARWVDGQVAPYVGSLPWSRVQDLLEAKIVEVDPAAAEARRQAAALERFVHTGQCNEYGLKTIVAKATAGDAVFFVAMCNRIAEVLLQQGDTSPVGVRRSKAIGILANPAHALTLLATHAATATAAAPEGEGEAEASDGPRQTRPSRYGAVGRTPTARPAKTATARWPTASTARRRRRKRRR